MHVTVCGPPRICCIDHHPLLVLYENALRTGFGWNKTYAAVRRIMMSMMYCIVLYYILRNPLRWSIFLPLYSIHGEVCRCADVQIRYITKQ